MRTTITSADHAEEIPLEAMREALAKREAAAAALNEPVEITARDSIEAMRTAVAAAEHGFAIELRERGLTWDGIGRVFGITGAAARYRIITADKPDGADDVSPEIFAAIRDAIAARADARVAEGLDTDRDIAHRKAITDLHTALAAVQREAIHALRERGLTWDAISKIYGVSVASATYRSLTPEVIRSRRASASRRPTLEAAPGLSALQVAAAIGKNHLWVKRRLSRPGIESIEYQRGERKLVRILTPVEEFKRLAA